MRDEYYFARIAYDAYCKSVGGKSIRGETLPEFNQQTEKIKDAWFAAALAVLTVEED